MARSKVDLEAVIEAALYASGRPLSPEDLIKATSTKSRRRVVAVARSVMRRLNASMKAIEVVELPNQKFAMQLRQSFNRVAKKFATRPLLPYSVLKTLSYIAYFQPITSRELAVRRGSQVYQHLRTLREIGFVKAERTGRTKTYQTTDTFADYFGLSRDPRLLKMQLSKTGLKRPSMREGTAAR